MQTVKETQTIANNSEIDCGIGTINYSTNNLALEELMEALSARIKKYGPLVVRNDLEKGIYPATTLVQY